jgi:transcriptional regulator with XRE-family HTH domain
LAQAFATKLLAMKKPSKTHKAREVFAKNLRRQRRLRDISQEELALRSGLSRTYVSEVERAGRNISIDNMGLLANALQVPLKDLVDTDMFKALDQS